MALTAWYRMNDVAASTYVEDGSGNARHGTAARNTTLMSVLGKLGTCLDFNGTTDVVNCGTDFIGTSACTIAAWIYLNGWGEGVPGVGYGRIVDNGSFLFYVAQDSARLVCVSRTGGVAYSANSSIGLGVWIHVIVTRTSAGVANLYVNGVISGTENQASGTPAAATTNLFLGNRSANDRTFAGMIDDLRIYDEALTVQQIQAIYNAGMGSSRPYSWQPRIVRPTLRPILQGVA